MKVWIVGIESCEGNRIVAVCATKPIAEKYLFKARDMLVEEWREMEKMSSIYTDMIKNLSSDNYEKWNNFPHDCPYLYDIEVKEK